MIDNPQTRRSARYGRASIAVASRPTPQPRGHSNESSALDSWENEGGGFQSVDPPVSGQTIRNHGPKLDELDAEIRRMSNKLSEDFANGCVGSTHNTYQHRSRVIRQLIQKRDAAKRRSD